MHKSSLSSDYDVDTWSCQSRYERRKETKKNTENIFRNVYYY